MNISPQASQPLSAIRSPFSVLRPLFQLSSFSFQLFLLLSLSACASPRPVADQYSRENSSRVVSRGPAPMDDAEARKLASGGPATSTLVKKKSSNGHSSKTTEEVVSSTTTETVIGRQAVAAPDAEISPR